MQNKLYHQNMKKIIIGLLALIGSLGANAQKISFEKSTINMGTTKWKEPVTATFKFTNKDRTPLLVRDVDAGCGCLTTKWTTDALQRGEDGEIRITYDAQMMGSYDKIIEVFTNADSKPTRIRMKGRIGSSQRKSIDDLFPYRIDDILLSTNNVEFPQVAAGDSATVSIEIYNASKEVYTPQLMHLPPYITASFSPQMLAVGRRGKIDLTVHTEMLQELGLNQTSIYLARFSGDKVNSNNDITVSAIKMPDLKYAETFTKKPSFHVSSTEINLGKLGKKQKAVGQIKISNRGNGVLKLNKIQSFNQAIVVTLPKTELQPGEQITMKINLDARFLNVSKAQPRVLIISNDPRNPQEVINIHFDK